MQLHTTPTLQRPLQVYLDSSDFSLLANPKERTAELDPIRRDLETLKRQGDIELRFSLVHVVEAAPVDERYLESGTARLTVIHELCYPHALLAPQDVMSTEASKLYGGNDTHRDIFKNDGDWLPTDLGNLALPTRTEVVRKIIDDMGLGRAKRREAERKYLRSGGITREASKVLEGCTDEFLTAIAGGFPLTDAAGAALRSYLAGPLSGIEAMRAVVESIHDLRRFADWLNKQWDEVRGATQWLRESGERLRLSMIQTAQSARKLREKQLGSGLLSEQQMLEIGRRELAKVRHEFVAKTAHRVLPSPAAQAAIIDPAKAALAAPSLTTMAAVLFGISASNIFQLHNPRLPKRSDAGDMTHCLYLPHVDLFRTDGFIADLIKQSAPQYFNSVVPNLTTLMPRIADRLRRV